MLAAIGHQRSCILVRFFFFFRYIPGIFHWVEGLVISIVLDDAGLFGLLVLLLSYYQYHRR